MPRADRFEWGKVGRHWIANQVNDPENLAWQRVAWAAWLRVGFDGVATFARGELAEAAAGVNPHTGEVSCVSNAPRALKRAIARGWVGPGSTTTRVIVPGNVYGVGRW